MFTRFVSTLLLGLALAGWCAAARAAEPAAERAADRALAEGHKAEAEGHKAEAEAGDINPLSASAIKADLAIWTAVVFLVVMAILTKFAWGPLAEGLDKREKRIADHIAQAELSHQKAKELLGEYEKKLAAAQDDVRALIDQGRRDAEALGRQMLDKAKDEAKAEQERALRQIDAATAGALKELADLSASLAVQLAGRILQTQLKPADHAKLIQQAVSDFATEKAGANGSRKK